MMRSFWSNPWFVIPVLLFFIAGLSINLFVPHGDEILALNSWRTEPFNTFFRWATRLGEYYAYVVLTLLVLPWRYRYALLIALTGLVVIPVSYTAKEQFRKDRPITWFKNQGLASQVVAVPEERLNTGRTSFPSGHTMASFALFSAMTVLVTTRRDRRPWALLFALLAILTAISRVFLVQHFLADVLAGAVAGMLIAEGVRRLLSSRFFTRFRALDKGFLKDPLAEQ